MTEPVLYAVRDHTAWITLNRPDNHNALSHDLSQGLLDAVDRAAQDDGVRMVVLASEGRTFCAGADLKSRGGGAVQERGAGRRPPFIPAIRALWDCPRPVIGRIQGGAFGGGLGLMAACDFAICADTARFAFTEVRLGLAPSIISVFVMRKVTLADATALMLTGRRFDAAEACRVGLAHRAVPADGLDAAVADLQGELLQCGPRALGEVKRLLRAVPAMGMEEGLTWAHEKNLELFNGEEGREGMAAFAEKRKPRWAP